MQVVFSNISSNKKQPSFQHRSSEIRFAYEVMRRTNRCFPRISTSKLHNRIIELSDTVEIQPKYVDYVNREIKKCRFLRKLRPNRTEAPSQHVKQVFADVKQYRIANCDESATLGKVALALNGIPSIKAALCVYKDGVASKIVDHAFDLVHLKEGSVLSDVKGFGKDSYVVDLWKDSVDYSSNAFQQYETEFPSDFLPDIEDMSLSLGISLKYDFEISESTLNEIKQNYPELVIK